MTIIDIVKPGKQILASLGYYIYKICNLTYRIQWINDETYKSQPPDRSPYIFAHWHENDLALIGPHKNRGYNILVSLSKDGDIMSYATSKLGYKLSRGSSTSGGARGLIRLIRAVSSGEDAVIAVDGPRGPRHVVKPGIVLLSLKSKTAIVPVCAFTTSRFVFWKSWSRFYLPKPFAKIKIIYGNPIQPPKSNDAVELESCRIAVEQELESLHKKIVQT